MDYEHFDLRERERERERSGKLLLNPNRLLPNTM